MNRLSPAETVVSLSSGREVGKVKRRTQGRQRNLASAANQ